MRTVKDLSLREVLELIQFFRYTRESGYVPGKVGETGLYEALQEEAKVKFKEFEEYHQAVEAAVTKHTKTLRESN